jgi:tetratricopeptide (TPR) repeat protein
MMSNRFAGSFMPRPKAAPALPPLLSAAYRLQTDGHLDHAEAGYRAVLASEPQRIEAMELLARLRRQRGDLAEALGLYAAMMKAAPRSAEAASNHGVVLVELGRPGEALAGLDRALILKPNMVAALYNRGNALMALGRFAEALTSFERAIAIEPAHVDAHYNRGNTLRELRRHDEALASYRQAAALAPQRADIRVNEALTLLLIGKLREGFSVYEWRRRATPEPQAPLWLGAVPLAGRTILIHAEQGFGDTLQFIRYAPLLVARGARVIAAVPPVLKPLIATMPGVVALTAGDSQPLFDFHCPMMSLPLAFGTELATIPGAVPYLRAPHDRVAAWNGRLAAVAQNGRRVGIIWAGNAGFAGDRHRSIPFAKLRSLLSTSGLTFIGLQRDIPPDDATALAALPDFINLGPDFSDFGDAAAVLSLLDLVITVDTALAHLAGAMAKPVFVMLPHAPDFRWMLDRRDSPWYPTARLFRQPVRGDWDTVLAQIGEALAQENRRDVVTREAGGIAAIAASLAGELADHLHAGRYAEALAAGDRAIAFAPQSASAHNDRARALAELGRFDEARAAFGRAIAIAPQFSAAIFNQGLVDLTLGDFASGWPKYEERFAANGLPAPGGGRRWTGTEPLAGKTVLVAAEQGFGDTLQFVRYAPLLADRGAQVILAVQPPLIEVSKSVAGIAQAISTAAPPPPHDFSVPLLSLPLAFGTTLASVPAQVPYIAADPLRTERWRPFLPVGGPRIGIAWRGTQSFAWAAERSIALAKLAPLLAQSHCRFISLQRTIDAEDHIELRRRPDIVHFGAQLGDFADTAAIIAELDLVISIDTAVAHLAGALAKPVWLLLPFVADFRWLRERADSPWYPTARLFRQPTPGDWDTVIAKVAAELADYDGSGKGREGASPAANAVKPSR